MTFAPEVVERGSGTVLACTKRRSMLRSRIRAPRHRPSAAAGSWLAIVAATTLGDAAETVRAEIRADGALDGTYRLVVQSYESAASDRPGRYQRPTGSTQRVVTAAELRDGVHVGMLAFRGPVSGGVRGPTVLAWIETGEPDLEFDGRMARPGPGSMYGLARRAVGEDLVQVSLNRIVG